MAKESEIIYHSPRIKSWQAEGYFIIPDVIYRGKTGTYALFEKMTYAMNQKELAKFYEKEKSKGNPYPTDAPLIWAICTSAYELKNKNPETSEKLKNLLKNNLKKCPNTLTAIIYNLSWKDRIIHNAGTSDEYLLNEWVVGLDYRIDEIPDRDILEKLLGTDNTKQINEVSSWINNTGMIIWRLNSKPERKQEDRVARFDAAVGGLLFVCGGNPPDRWPAFRVLKVD